MRSPNSADMNSMTKDTCTDSPAPKASEAKDKDTTQNKNSATTKKDAPQKPKVGPKVGSKVGSNKPPHQQPTSAGLQAQKNAEKFDNIEKLLITMHRESRENKQEMVNRLNKLENDYQAMAMNMGDKHGEEYDYYHDYEDEILDDSDAYNQPSSSGSGDLDHGSSLFSIKDLLEKNDKQNEQSSSHDETASAEAPNMPSNGPVLRPPLSGFSRRFADVEQLGEPAPEAIAKDIDMCLSGKLKEAKVAEVLKLYPTPSNLRRLKAPKLNQPIWSNVKENFRKFDQRLQRIQTSVTAAMTAMTRSINNDDEMSQDMENAFALLCNASNEMSTARKEHLKPGLNPAYVHLCKKPTGIDNLFGDDLQQNVKEIREETQAVMACTKKKFGVSGMHDNFRGRGGRDKRFHPYTYGQRGRSFLGRGHYPQQFLQGYNRGRGRFFQGRGKAPATATRASQNQSQY